MTEPVRYEVVGYGADVVPLYDRSDEVADLRTQVRLLTDEVERLRLTDDEREAIADALEANESEASLFACEVATKHAATLRGLLERHGGANESPAITAAPAQNIPPDWLQRPYYVDPPTGWAYGFPRLYDPATDGDMTEWLIACGYPETLARQGLPCTFTQPERLNET